MIVENLSVALSVHEGLCLGEYPNLARTLAKSRVSIRNTGLLGVRKGNLTPPVRVWISTSLEHHFLTIHTHCWDQSVKTEAPGWFAQTWGQIGKWGCIGTLQGWPGKNWDQEQSWCLNSSIRSKILGIHRAPSPQAGRYKAKTAQCTRPGLSRATASFSKFMCFCSPTCNPTCIPRRCCCFYGVETPSPALLVCPVSASMPTEEVLLFFSTVKTRELFNLNKLCLGSSSEDGFLSALFDLQ